ncbi:MAG: hypothetical protein IJR46_00285 [Neisseriaceae bacterium]|nr:hypothetical protein [Neisseriaceae bacterium]
MPRINCVNARNDKNIECFRQSETPTKNHHFQPYLNCIIVIYNKVCTLSLRRLPRRLLDDSQ